MVHVSGPVSDPICDEVAALCDKGERGEGREGRVCSEEGGYGGFGRGTLLFYRAHGYRTLRFMTVFNYGKEL